MTSITVVENYIEHAWEQQGTLVSCNLLTEDGTTPYEHAKVCQASHDLLMSWSDVTKTSTRLENAGEVVYNTTIIYQIHDSIESMHSFQNFTKVKILIDVINKKGIQHNGFSEVVCYLVNMGMLKLKRKNGKLNVKLPIYRHEECKIFVGKHRDLIAIERNGMKDTIIYFDKELYDDVYEKLGNKEHDVLRKLSDEWIVLDGGKIEYENGVKHTYSRQYLEKLESELTQAGL